MPLFSRGTGGKYARHVYYTYNSQLYTPVVYKDVKRRGCTRPRFHVPPPSGGPPLNNAITQELWQLNDTLCIIIRLRYRSPGHSVLRGSRVVGPPPPLFPINPDSPCVVVISSAILLSRIQIVDFLAGEREGFFERRMSLSSFSFIIIIFFFLARIIPT